MLPDDGSGGELDSGVDGAERVFAFVSMPVVTSDGKLPDRARLLVELIFVSVIDVSLLPELPLPYWLVELLPRPVVIVSSFLLHPAINNPKQVTINEYFFINDFDC